MKIDDFVKKPSFSKYADTIEKIREEFIEEGCEKFLFTGFEEQLEAMEYTEKLLKDKSLVENEKIKNFIDQFSEIDFENKVAFIYPENNSENFYVAQELSKQAEQHYIIQNIFKEDDTINWIAVFNKNEGTVIEDMFHVVYSGYMDDNYGGYKLFEYGLMYYADALEYNGNMLQASWPLKYVHFQGNNTRRDTNPYIVLASRKSTKMLVQLGYFNDELEIHWNMQNYLLPFLQQMYEDASVAFDKSESKEWKNRISEIKSDLVANGTINGKWKNEQSLFKIVKELYEDAIFQYRTSWLQPQSLDIYIPSLKLGIEYQGQQHYQSVDFFGGEEAFKHRKTLDKRKRELCKENNIVLLYWPYTEPVLKKRVIEVLEPYGKSE